MTGKRRAKSGKVSAGLLMYRRKGGQLKVFLVHPGGPFFARKDEGVWSIPKGEVEEGDELLPTAVREFEEETGIRPTGEQVPLGAVRQRAGKTVHAWAFEGDYDPTRPIRSNTFRMEWPPRSGRMREFPEVDRAAFYDLVTAKRKINPAQAAFIDTLESLLSQTGVGPPE